jgi:peptide/nickel transport system substrate-binding protein
VPNDHVTLVRNDKYWDGTPRLASITFKFILDETARLTAFQAGDVDAMTTIVQATVDEAMKDGFRAVVPPITGYGLVHLNNKVAPLDDKRVRKALDLAIDHHALAEAFGYSDYDVEGYGVLPPSNAWFSAPPEKPKYDLEAAKALVAEYGKPVKITLKLLKGSQDIADSFDVMAEMWKEAGMDVTIESVPDLTSLITSVLTGKYEAAAWLAGISVDADLTFYPMLHSKGASNYSKYSSPEMDAAIEEGRSGATREARMASYAKVQQIFRDDMPYLMTSHGQIRFLINDKVAGMQASGFFPTNTAGVKAG